MGACGAVQHLARCGSGPMAWRQAAVPFGSPFALPCVRARADAPRRRPWPHVWIAHVVKRDERRRVVATERRRVAGTPARVETRRPRSQGAGVIKTAASERPNATCRARLAPWARRCRVLARPPLTLPEGMGVVGTGSNGCTPQASVSQAHPTTPALAAGITDQCGTMHELRSCPWAAVALVTTQATWASLTGAQPHPRAMVRGPRLAVELPNGFRPV